MEYWCYSDTYKVNQIVFWALTFVTHIPFPVLYFGGAGKDVFEAFYRRFLSKRLLLNRSVSNDKEKNLLSKIRTGTIVTPIQEYILTIAFFDTIYRMWT